MKRLPTLIVLAGGLGTRLRSAVPDLPKILAPVNGVPYLTHFLRWCRAKGIVELHFCLGYKADAVIRELKFWQHELNISWQVEVELLGTGGAIKLALETLQRQQEHDAFIVCNGDTFVDMPVSRFVSEAEKTGGALLTSWVSDAGRYGQVLTDEDNRLLRFQEKNEAGGAGYVNAGWYYLGAEHIANILSSSLVSFERDYLMFDDVPPITCLNMADTFLDYGTPESYRQAQHYFGSN
ncbi:MAG: sugar phosphate nucleotidyltransferase [Pseudomonadota bacterium]|nr:sugar phosphate nucleotidyltransferase [Pseudomonadota bacterium]